MSMSTRCQFGCPAVEKLASLQQAPGRLHVETWADGNTSLPISQVVEIMPGCADVVICLPPSSLLFRVTWAGQRSSEWDWLVPVGENSQVWCMVVPGCLAGNKCIFCIFGFGWVGTERIVPHGVGGPPLFPCVLVHTCMGEARLSGHKLESGAGHCMIDCGGLSLP